MKPAADEAVAEAPSVEHVIVYERLGADVPMTPGRDLTWDELRARGLAEAPDGIECEDTGAEDVLMIAYTSGTTGKPKGAVHVHGGFLVKMASETVYQTDLHPDETLYWVTDMGWIMGPWEMVGAGCVGATVVMYEGAPDWPEPDRVWASVEQHGVNVLGVSPTLIRALKTAGDEHPAKHDLSSLRVFGSTGEPWNPEPYRWLSEVVGGGRLPIINISGGTEVGACFITPYPVEEIKVCSLGGASHGMDIDVFDPDGNSVRGKVGELVCKRPWPGMTRGIWGDPERYIETYWSMYPDVWRHGDWALIDDEGDWFLLGRSDDTINVAGKRLGPAEVESVLVSHPGVAESAVVGVPHETKGEAIWCFCVATGADGDGIAEELRELVATRAGTALQAVARGVRRGAAEDALGQDPAARGARGRDRRGPGRHVVGREPAGARADPRGAGLAGLCGRRVQRVDAAHELLDEVRRSLDGVGLDALRRVGRAVELRQAPVCVEAADGDRGEARHRGLRGVGADAPDVRLRAELLAQPHEALVAAEDERVSVRGHVVHVAVADRVDVHEERVARVDLVAVLLQPCAHAERQSLLGGGEHEPGLDAPRGALLEPAARPRAAPRRPMRWWRLPARRRRSRRRRTASRR